MKKIFLLFLGACVLTGCASIKSTFYETNNRKIYGGTRIYAECFTSILCTSYYLPVAVVDLPLSLVADTVLLPYDIYLVENDYNKRYGVRKPTPN